MVEFLFVGRDGLSGRDGVKVSMCTLRCKQEAKKKNPSKPGHIGNRRVLTEMYLTPPLPALLLPFLYYCPSPFYICARG